MQKLKAFKNENLPCSLFSKFDDFRNDDRYTDITIETNDGRKFAAHKNILAASSPFWDVMFQGDFSESNEATIPLRNINSPEFDQIMSYVYKGEFTVTSDTVQAMYTTADFLLYDFIKEKCILFMEDTLHRSTYYAYLCFAESYMLSVLKEDILQFIQADIDNVHEDEAFCNIPVKVVCQLLRGDNLKPKSESIVLNAVVKYLDYNKDLPLEQKNELVDTVRYGLINPSDFPRLRELEPFVGLDKPHAIKDSLLSCLETFKQPLLPAYFFKPRSAPRLLLMGGKMLADVTSSEITSIVVDHHIFKKETDVKRQLPEPVYSFTSVLVGNFVFCMGGRNGNTVTSNVNRYDILKNEWLAMENMIQPRHQHVAALCGDKIIVAGGLTVKRDVNIGNIQTVTMKAVRSVECYDIENNSWASKNAFPKLFQSAASCSDGCTVYISGGRLKSHSETISTSRTIYQYDNVRDIWLNIGDLITPCFAHSMLYSNSKVYVIGGCITTTAPLPPGNQRVQCFDLATNQCVLLKPLPVHLGHVPSTLLNGKIYIGARYRGQSKVEGSILIYDISTDSWVESIKETIPRANQ